MKKEKYKTKIKLNQLKNDLKNNIKENSKEMNLNEIKEIKEEPEDINNDKNIILISNDYLDEKEIIK